MHQNQLLSRLKNNLNYFIGYPTACDFSYDYLSELLNFPLNNIGDAFSSNVIFSSHQHEIRVIEFMLHLYHSNTKKAWGYITSCSSESILYCIWQARNYLRTRDKEVICITSNHSHYCISKSCDITHIPLYKVKNLINGEIDLADFRKTINHLNPKKTSIILIANIGTTVTSAIDDIYSLKSILKNNQFDFYIHADAAFDGMILPFIDHAPKLHLSTHFDSVSISGHKFIGSPMPCGILLIDKKYTKKNPLIEYIDINDQTLGGSRNGITPVLLYEAIKKFGHKGLKLRANSALNYANELIHHFKKYQFDVWKNPYAITIVFNQLPELIKSKWHLPSLESHSSITALPKLTQNILESFTTDLVNYQEGKIIDLSNKKEYPRKVESLI